MQHKLVCTNPSKTILGDELRTGVSYTHCVNSETDLTFGQVASAQITFTTTYSSLNKNTVIDWYCIQGNDNGNWRLMGKFNVSSVKKEGESYNITAYDNVSLLDKDVSSILGSTSSSTLNDLYQTICYNCVGNNTWDRSAIGTNDNRYMAVDPKELITAGITGRTVMKYMAECWAGYVVADTSGKICAKKFTTRNITVTDADYSSITIADQPAPRIQKLTVQLSSGSKSVTASGGTAEVQYLYNPFFYNKSGSDITTNVQNIVNNMSSIGTYYACTFKMFNDKNINVGDIIDVVYKGDTRKVIVMTKSISESGCTITCTGDPSRTAVVTENTDRITNLEANKGSFENLLTDAVGAINNIQFCHNITVNDVYIPSGIGYLNNPACVSLVEVIQALLIKTELNPHSSSTFTLNMTELDEKYHTFDTGLNNTWAYQVSGDISYSNGIITCTGISNNGTATFRKTSTYPDGSSETIVYTYNVNCYSYIVNHGDDFYLDYVGEQEYGNVAYQVYRNGAQIVPYTANTDVDNTYISVEQDVTAGLKIVFKQTGTYTFLKGDPVHAFPEQTFKFLSN